jgi:hypothetical protein
MESGIPEYAGGDSATPDGTDGLAADLMYGPSEASGYIRANASAACPGRYSSAAYSYGPQ